MGSNKTREYDILEPNKGILNNWEVKFLTVSHAAGSTIWELKFYC